MAFPPGFLDELRSRISLSGLIGRRVKLVRRGREFAGLCPFHHEKTPSFYIVEDKSFFHCFGCGAHGDVIGFAMRADNLDFIEAVEKLAGEAGLAVPQATPQERERAQRQKTLLEATEAAAAFYEERLWAPGGARAREYLQGRGLDPETIRRFRLGWAPDDRQALRRALNPEFSDPLLIEAGLRRRPAEGEASDYFRNRLMFPIGDRAGRVIAFGGRVLGDGQPKYLNSPDSPLFEKGRVLYGWSAARVAVIRDEEGGPQAIPGAIVTEGYMDVIALHQAGFATAVAPLGTALTEFQLHELWRLTPEPLLCFDGDAAGQRAAIRAMRRALPLLRPGQSLRFASLPAGEDPDSVVRQAGRGTFGQILATARPLSTVLWESELGASRLDTPERRAALERRLMDQVGLIADRTVQAEYRRFLRDRLFDLGRSTRSGPRHLPRPQPSFVRDGPEPPPRPGERIQRENLFRIILHFPYLIDQVAEEFSALEIPESDLGSLRCQILELDAAGSGLDAHALQQHLVKNGLAATVERLLLPSVDTTFLVRCSDPISAREEWVRVTRMLTGGDRCALAEATDELISDICPESWERFLAARERALLKGSRGDDET
ncbi:MAG: DNA primase [Alphaproteobacteria bacterium]|nr:DNA primase [Alphaproteobacteria bacterium]